MTYKITTVTDICNAGSNVGTILFDDWYDVQDYIEQLSTDEDALYNIRIDEL